MNLNDNNHISTSTQFENLKNKIKITNEDTLNLLSKKTKKTIKKKNKQTNKRKDYLYKQIKIHTLKFAIQTINDLLKELVKLNQFNPFYLLQNKFNNELKDNLTKQFNIQLMDKTLKDILIQYSKNNNQKIIEELNDNEKFNLIHKILNLKFIDLINIYVMTNKQFKEKFNYENKFLLVNDSSIVNKNEIVDLFDSDIKKYLYNKRDLQK